MTGKIVNLNKARKARARAGDKARADVNAVKFGRTKAERELEKAREEKSRSDFDAHEREE